MLGMLLFLTADFSVFLSASSLLVSVDSGVLLLFALYAFNYVTLCARMAQEGELFAFSVLSHPSTLTNYIGPFIIWSMFYLLICTAPMIVAVLPTDFGPGSYSLPIVWSSLTNGVMIFVRLGALENHPSLNMTNVVASYGGAMLIMAGGLALFFKNMEEGFDVSLFWRRKSGMEHVRECRVDNFFWEKAYKTEDEERWSWVAYMHPTYLPFDYVVVWLEDLATMYENEQMGEARVARRRRVCEKDPDNFPLARQWSREG